MWNLRNETEDHGRREGKITEDETERETNHKRLLITENKLWVTGGGGSGMDILGGGHCGGGGHVV